MLVTIENLEKELKQGNTNNIYLLYGEETFLLETCLKRIKNNFGKLIPGINYIKIDANNINSLIDDIETPAFGHETKLIIARDTGIFKKDGRKKVQVNAEIVNKISTYIEENVDIIKETVTIVFIEQEVDKNELYKTIEKIGQVCNFEELKPIQIVSRIKAICNGYKVQIDETTIKYLIENVRLQYARTNK